MEWDDFRHFLAVARSGSLAGAARALRTSPATVGRRIAALENRLGSRLFNRNQNGYTLNQGGEAIQHKAEEVEEAILSVERQALGRDLRATGKVRIATAEDIATFMICPKLADFRRSHPGITLEIVASWDVASLTRREADIALRTVRPTHGDFIIRKVGLWKCALYCSKAYAIEHDRKARGRGTAELSKLHVIDWTEENSFRGGGWFAAHTHGSPTVFAANSRHIQYAACKAGLGGAILPCVAADQDPDLIRLLPAERVRSIDLWLVVHRDLARTARVRATMEFLSDAASS